MIHLMPNVPSRDYKRLAQDIYEYVRDMGGGTTFAELLNCGILRGDGDYLFRIGPNRTLLLWTNLHAFEIDAFRYAVVEKMIEPHPTTPMVYMFDGQMLDLPVAKRPPKVGYKETHWLPTVYNLHPTRKGERPRRESKWRYTQRRALGIEGETHE